MSSALYPFLIQMFQTTKSRKESFKNRKMHEFSQFEGDVQQKLL